MKTLGKLLFSLSFALAGACASIDPLEGDGVAEETQEPIIGGSTTTGDTAVAALIGRVPGSDQAGLCTATLIRPTGCPRALRRPRVAGEGQR